MDNPYVKFIPELVSEAEAATVKDFNAAMRTGKLKEFKIRWVKTLVSYINREKKGDREFPRQIPLEDESTFVLTTVMEKPSWVALSIMAPYFRQKKEDQKVYVIQKAFFEKFKKVDFSGIQYRHLPKEICGFVELPEGIKDQDGVVLKWFFFFCGDENEVLNSHMKFRQEDTHYTPTGRILGCAYMSENFEQVGFHWRRWPEDEELSVKESFRDVMMIRMIPSVSGIEEAAEKREDGYFDHLALMINMLAYIHSGDPDIRDFKNPVRMQSPTSQTPVKADKHLSLSNIVQVGFSYKKETLKHTEEWAVMPHLRWQRCGIALSQIKLVMVKGYTKSWKGEKDADVQSV